MSVALITGSCGLVGAESVEFFSKKKFIIIGIDNDSRRKFFGSKASVNWKKKELKKKFKNYHHKQTDITNYKSLEKIFKRYRNKIKLIIHAAAQPSHDYAKKNIKLDFSINAQGTLNLLELTRKYCFNSPFIFMSTNKIYGDNPNKLRLKEKKLRWEPKNKKNLIGFDEKLSIDNCTHSFFGVSKSYADLLVQEYGKNFGLKTVCFRAGCITGPNHSGTELHGFLSYLTKKCLKDKSYNIIGHKGKQVRDNIHSLDLINCFWEFYKKPASGEVYNIGGGPYSNCSILEAINFIEKIKKINIRKKFIRKSRVGDHIWYVSNIRKFKKDYPNWKQKYNTKKILLELIST